LLGKQGRVAEAEILLRGALEQRRALFGADDVNIPWRLSELARVLDNNGEPQRALPLYREALANAERKMGPTSIPYAVLLNNLALATMRVGDYAESERHYRQAIAIVSEPWGESSEGLASLRFNLATLLAKTRPDEALKLLRLCEAVYAKAYPAQHVEVIATRLMLAVVSAEARDLQGARTWLQRVDAAQAELQPLTRADRAYAQARVLQLEGQMDAALAELERAETLRAQALDAADPRIWLAQIERAEWLVTRGHAGDAAASAALAREILTHLDTILVPDSPVRKRLAALM
jgi:tetratricopeptide (TPR) repeat protein